MAEIGVFEIAALGAFGCALLVGVLVVLTMGWHGRFSLDTDVGVQKFHDVPTPRIGGVALVAGLAAGVVLLGQEARALLLPVLAMSTPVFLAGLWEDLTKAVSPIKRLAAALLSGVAFVVFTGVLDPLASPLVPEGAGIVLTCVIYGAGGALMVFALAGSANAINIIDGFHGLAAGSLLIMSFTFAGLAGLEGDMVLAGAICVFAASVFGFMLVNFPGGYLFLGDAGAYLAGFVLGAFGILLAARTDISAFVSILVMAYPTYETLFSIIRKFRRPGYSPMRPDSVHLHMLVSRCFGRFVAFGLDRPSWKNPLTGVMMWPFSLVAACLAILAQGTNLGGVIGLVVFVLFYLRIYRLVSFRAVSFMRPLSKRWGWDEGGRYASRPRAGRGG